jgi:hypothetical protein
MPTLGMVKKIWAIFLSGSFLVNCIMVPFCNFQDTISAKILYAQFLLKDRDGDVLEFITHNILNMGDLFEDEDDDEVEPAEQVPPTQQQHPFQPIQINPGFLYCVQPIMTEDREQPAAPRVFCLFIDNNYKLDFSPFVFHPPSFCS